MMRTGMAFALGWLVLSATAATAVAVDLRDVTHSPRHVPLPTEAPVSISFELSEPAQVELLIYDGREILVRAISLQGPLRHGKHTIEWDLNDQPGRPVPPGAYHYRLEARTESGEVAFWDITDTSGGSRMRGITPVLSKDRRGLGYQLPKTALVRIRIGLANHGPLLRTLIDWVPREAGDQLEPWDGMDQSGGLELIDHPRLVFQFDAVQLPRNTILVGRPSPRVVPIADLPEPVIRRPQPKRRYKMHDYLQQAMRERRDFPAKLEIPQARLDTTGRPVVSGMVAVRLLLAEEDRRQLVSERFEAVFFVDGLMAFEVESAYFPITWRWNTEGLAPGGHYVTANLRGYEGHFAIATREVVIDETD